jgi:hypothetical protein
MFTAAEGSAVTLRAEEITRREDRGMPQIMVVADSRAERLDQAVMFTERVSVHDFESRHFQTQLVERLGWAVGDAHAAEQGQPVTWDDDDPPEDREHERTGIRDAQPVS